MPAPRPAFRPRSRPRWLSPATTPGLYAHSAISPPQTRWRCKDKALMLHLPEAPQSGCNAIFAPAAPRANDWDRYEAMWHRHCGGPETSWQLCWESATDNFAAPDLPAGRQFSLSPILILQHQGRKPPKLNGNLGEVQVRQLSLRHDRQALLDLMRQSDQEQGVVDGWLDLSSAERLRAWREDGVRLEGVFREGLLVASGTAIPLRGFDFIADVFVQRDHRRRGHARALMQHMVAHLRTAQPHRPVLLSVDARNPARHLYRDVGFAHISTLQSLMCAPPA